MDDMERILEKAHALRAKKAGEGNAGVLKPRLSAGELKDKKISTAPATRTPGQRSHANGAAKRAPQRSHDVCRDGADDAHR